MRKQPTIAFSKIKGFTLIEVLISAVILFSALAITAELYSASSLSAQKASNKARFYQLSPIAISTVKSQLRQQSENRVASQFSGQLAISGIKYNWEANRISFKPRAADFDDIEPPRQQFGLFLVNVVASEVMNNNKTTEFQFQVATW